jgi:hypothetical protein
LLTAWFPRRHREQDPIIRQPKLHGHPWRDRRNIAAPTGEQVVERALDGPVGRVEGLLDLVDQERPQRRIGGDVGDYQRYQSDRADCNEQARPK